MVSEILLYLALGSVATLLLPELARDIKNKNIDNNRHRLLLVILSCIFYAAFTHSSLVPALVSYILLLLVVLKHKTGDLEVMTIPMGIFTTLGLLAIVEKFL